MLHPDFLRRPCNGRQQSHQTLFVHLAAVAGEGVVAALHAEGKHDLAHHIGIKRGVSLRDAFAHGRFHPVDEQSLPGAGKQDADLGLIPGKGPEHFPGQPLGALAHITGGQLRQAFHHHLHHFVLHGVGQRIDILIMGIKGGLIDAGQIAQLLDLDLFQRFLRPQLHECLLDGTLRFFNANIQKIHLFCNSVDYPTIFLFCG